MGSVLTMHDEIFVSVQMDPKDPGTWEEVGSHSIPASLDDETACLIGKGMVYENDWIRGSINVVVIREDSHGVRVLYEGK